MHGLVLSTHYKTVAFLTCEHINMHMDFLCVQLCFMWEMQTEALKINIHRDLSANGNVHNFKAVLQRSPY